MPHRVAAQGNFTRSKRKLTKKNKPLNKLISEAVKTVIDDPSVGEPYTANLLGLHKFTFGEENDKTPRHRQNRPFYRLVYTHYECCKKIDNCKYADVPLEEGETDCSGLIEFVQVMNRNDARNLYKKDPSYIKKLLR